MSTLRIELNDINSIAKWIAVMFAAPRGKAGQGKVGREDSAG